MEYLQEAKKLSDSLDAFLELHESQLQAIGLPRILYSVLWAKFEANQIGTDAYDHFEWAKVDGPSGALQVVAKKDLPPQQAVVVFSHDWTFISKDQAKMHLESSPELRTILAHHIRQLDVVSKGFISDEEEKTDIDTNGILENLYRVAFQYQVHTPPTAPAIYNYVSADPFGPHVIPFAGNNAKPVLESRIFVRTSPDPSNTSKNINTVYTVLFPNVNPPSLNELSDSDIIKKGTAITRSEMTTMPDYSTPRYWMHHYRESVHRNYEWFVPWAAIGPCIKDSLPTRDGIVLNIGCGNSRVGDGIIRDRLAGSVLSVDIAAEALTALSSTKPKPKSKPLGVEDLLQLDAASDRLPFRQGDRPLFDWAFDKGTLDGLVSSPEGVALAKKIWTRVAKLTGPDGVFVLVSLGSPEGRLPLIEDVIGGWEVDACMEIEIPKTAGSAFGVPGGGRGLGAVAMDRCFVYVCKKVAK
ncbi:hypothetical protein HDU67_005872 [Dinochytrium kinnereticum]|nr:hypothetical protein HDU67_005872 [Dinochytrium kinnereticum]